MYSRKVTRYIVKLSLQYEKIWDNRSNQKSNQKSDQGLTKKYTAGRQLDILCGKAFATPQKLRGHQNRKFLCKPAAKPQDPTPEIVQLQPQPEQFQDPTPEIVQLQSQPEQLQDPTPEVIPAHAEKTPNLTIDELAKWLAEPGDYNQYTPRKRRAPQTDNEWFAYMQGDYRRRWCDIQFVKRVHDPARSHKSLKHKTVWQVDLKPNVRDIPYFPSIIADTRQKITEILESELEEKGQIKSAITILATYTDNSGTNKQVYHRGVMRVFLLKNDIDDHLTKSAVDITDKIVKFMKGGSGWKIVSIDILTIETYTYCRAEGGSYILTPKALANKKCTINPDNKDLLDPDTGLLSEKCLQGALGAYFAYKDGHTQKLERIFQAEKFKLYLEQVNLNAIPMPTPVCPRIFSKIEDLNPEISINVWEWEEKTGIPKPVIASKNYNRQHIIHLMALTDITKSDEGNFPSSKSLTNHQEWCFGLGEAPQRVELPVKGKNDFEEFKNFNRTMYAPCVIIADFEADNRKCNENYGENMHKIMEQKANSFCYMVHWIETDETWGPFLYRGPNATEEFVSRLDKELRRINDVLEVKVERIITEEAKKEFTEAVSCWIFCESVKRSIGAHQIKVIAETFERYKSMKVGQFKYIDSMQFMASSLANLAKNLGTDKPLTKRHFKNFSSEHIDLITRKGVYPYEYIDSHDRFKETELPSIHDFHSTLGGKITQDNYKHAQKVWKEFGCKNLGEWEASPEYFKQNPDKQKQILNVILNTKPDAAHGYFLNIKAHYPLRTHDYLQDLPPAVDSIAVKKDRLNPYITKLVDNLDGGRFPETEKLVPHLGKHEDYVIHYQELQYYIKLGMVVDEITQVLSFDQDNWLAPYIAKNTNLRQQSKNSFEKDFFKLMNNSIYGKTMENVRKYQDVKLMRMINENDEKKFLKKVRKPSFKYARQLGNTLVGAHMGKASVILNKPIIIGASVLGLSKLLMYRFWYGFVKEKYENKVRLGYMDTDSFIYHVETEDIYKDMAERPDLFDLNDIKTIGLFKDETPGNVITESYHIRAKSYHYVLADKSTKSKHKGVSKKGMSDMAKDTYFPSLGGTLLDDTVEKDEIFDPMTQVYQDCLFENNIFYAKNVGMRTKNHVIFLIESEKKALSPIDTKRWIWSDGISSLPFGHWRIQVYKKLLERGTSHEAAEKIAIGTRLPEKY
ncbi:uncharacterized protein OCT59_007216 [Rhizophagus irregularis]|nr:hypothetical protein OCT59_007216 [Rhizophagus irregularis]